MSVHRLNINEDVLKMPAYKKLFDEIYADIPESERYTKVTAGLAIAAYERTLLSNQAHFKNI
ncbi:MAG: cytochrome c peroxidase [Saprospiraceae bacterium]